MSSLNITKAFVKGQQAVSKSGYQIDFMHFDGPENSTFAPILFLGGAFQKLISFRRDVEFFSKYTDVYLVDLPGLGGNSQVSAELSFDDLAGLLNEFFDLQNLERATVVCYSYSSIIGYRFATMFPERMSKLIAGGITERVRDSIKYLLSESLISLSEQRMDDFSAGVIFNLLNFSRRKEIPVGEDLLRSLYKNMKGLSKDGRRKYFENMSRLLRIKEFEGVPTCETLIMAGEYDNFVTPFECFKLAKKTPNSCFAIVKGVDHFAPFQKKSFMNDMILNFLRGERLKSCEECEIYRQGEYPKDLRQIEPRFSYRTWAFITGATKEPLAVKLLDINQFGCCLMSDDIPESFLGRMDLSVTLPLDGVEFEGVIFMNDQGLYRMIFKRYNISKELKLEKFVQDIMDSEEFCVAS